MLTSFLSAGLVTAAEADARFHVHVSQEGESLNVATAMKSALPTLWQRVVPTQSLEKTALLRGRTSLVLQFKRNGMGADLVFNPVQVQAYLRQNNITMIVERPHWNLSIVLDGFVEAGTNMAADLMGYSYSVSDALGFQLDSQGRKLGLTFTQVMDVYGATHVQVDVSGAFSTSILRETKQPIQDYLSYQLQAWLDTILREIRDAYSSELVRFQDVATNLYITVMSDASLAGQVSLEQLLAQQAEVLSVIPSVMQKESRQYRIIIRDADDSWVESWFASYGMTAVKQPVGSTSQWLVE
ncbi:MAG: hypothetical protein Q9M44_06145 [Ghiorsea sp.]|nr:hypothetical protein [Ghiorsea sp.]